MKVTFKALAWMLGMAAVCWGCDLRDNVIEYQQGVWNVKQLETKVYHDGVLVAEETRTDSLGQMQFDPTGQGFRIDFSAQRDTFTWEHYIDERRLVIYYRVGQFDNAAILKKSANEMTLFWINTGADGAVMVQTESTSIIERAD